MILKKYTSVCCLLIILISQNACREEYLNPSAASEQQVINSPDGLLALANGLQSRYTAGRLGAIYNAVAAGGLTTREFRVLNAGNVDEIGLEAGLANVTNQNSVVRQLWTSCLIVNSNADIILANTDKIAEAGTKSGIVAYAAIFKALSLGTLAQFFEQAPIKAGENAPFVPRAQLLAEAIAQLEAAATLVGSTPLSDKFKLGIVPGIDIPNTLQALIARYSLFAGDYTKALAAAGKVDLTKRSFFSFDDNTRNPIFETAFSNRNVIEPTNATLGLPTVLMPDPADKRIALYIRTTPSATQNLGTGFATANNAPLPVYLPGEMLLIRAEALIRSIGSGGSPTNVTLAIAELNKVLTKTAATDAWGLGAALPAYLGPVQAADVLTEIYRNRAIELAYSGFRLEDSRRFGRSGPSVTGERNRNFMPYPRTERDNNTSTPAKDPD
ncbi:RagB/SusD family nutrient uptake outer membrane protein [Larkinella humicola]|uniref:RagB/SusD family nutrient uptake outer membrane protein n=1 Tax=Larkinella humicola TaxID=2607654 RepID=A0A5N1JS40_9BACT|nr:RagB/SusD family nutrient uptake outer membrane protein [Larkinella humicola]KAA9357449.1 RagB/SusD family nutrient uptake outer membrane protein [Larkinella humicola]